MHVTDYSYRIGFRALIAALFLLLGSGLQAQTKQLLAWQDDLASLQDASSDALVQNRTAVMQIRSGVEFWMKFHPGFKEELAAAPMMPWGAEDIRTQVTALHKIIEGILKADPAQPFDLGVTLVSVSAEASTLSPVADSLGRTEIADRQLLTLTTALDGLPGVTIDHPSGQRNEAQGRIRGFSTRGQVPFYLDGIPVYIPYDGYVDFNRFLTSDIAEVQVAKGYSSPLMGPNSLAGSINLVTKQPEKKFESDALIGTGSGGMLLSSLRLGTRWDKFYIQGSVDWLQRDYIPLSGNFTLNNFQLNDHENHSASRDEKYTGRIAWTPKGQDQYAFSYTNQKGEKDGLLYIGPNPNATFRNFWKWPYWNKDSYYLLTNTGIGEQSSIKFRAYYDQFRNDIDMYDDATYTTMKKSSAEHSMYNEHTDGASTEFDTRLIPHNTIGSSLYFKDDTHSELGVYPGKSPYPFTTPVLALRDQQVSIGIQDVITLLPRLRLTLGYSADHMKGLMAEAYNSASTALVPVTCFSSPKNTSYNGCTAHVWNNNPQASVSYTLTSKDTLFAIFSDRGRFALLKETYSYKMGTAVPNPDLEPEHSRNWDFGYSRSFAARTLLQIEYFQSNLRDAIQPVYILDTASICPNNTGALKGYCSENVNIGTEVHKGTEISIRSTPARRLTFDASYSYINRTLAYDFSKLPNVSQINTSISTLPTLPKNKFVGNATFSMPHQILAMAAMRYDGGIFLQDTTYTPAAKAFAESYGTVDIGTVVPIKAGVTLQAGIKNLLDRNYYYSAGYPEIGRNWYFNLRYRF